MTNGAMFQLGDAGNAFVLEQDGTRGESIPLAQVAPSEPAPDIAPVIGRIAPTRIATVNPRSFRAELKARRAVVMCEVARLKKFQTELDEIDKMLAALKRQRTVKKG